MRKISLKKESTPHDFCISFPYSIFVYIIDSVRSFSSHKDRYTFFTAYPRAMDGGASWVFITYIRGTAAAIVYICIGDITVGVYNSVHATVSIITYHSLTQVYLGAT